MRLRNSGKGKIVMGKKIEVKWENSPVLEKEIQSRLDSLTKPKGSLGRLEEFAMQYCKCKNSVDAVLENMRMFTFAGDHGIVKEGVCPYPAEVTRQMVLNMIDGGAAVSVMGRHAGIISRVVDMGVNADFEDDPLLIKCKIARGTESFLRGPAMSNAQCSSAVDAGVSIAENSGADLIGIGEMGIGNSSSASALYSILLDVDPAETAGKGTGATGIMLEHKKKVIASAVEMHRKQWNKTAMDALARVGGYEIAGMTGCILGSAASGIPVVVDGFIASSAALVAIKICPDVKRFLFFAHESNEQFHRRFLFMLNIKPMLELDMRLGEGTGAVLGMQLVDQAMHLYHEMATFSSAGVSDKK
jgi:nicotinate-nucleotide--dimethylbenzimidazole phosphoribosyltransferase